MMIDKVYNFFKKDTMILDMPVAEKEKQQNLHISAVSSVYGRNSLDIEMNQMFGGDEDERRKKLMSLNMDDVVKGIKREKVKQPLLSRTINNIVKGALKEGYYFKSDSNKASEEKITAVMNEFHKILHESSYEPRQFLRELLINQTSYSNSFIIPKRSTGKSLMNSGRLERIVVIQNTGWTVKESVGTSKATKWIFCPNMTAAESLNSSSTVYQHKDLWHYTMNKESDEIFGMPLWCSVIPFIKHYNNLLSKSISSYNDQAIEKNIYVVGGGKNGSKFVTPDEFSKVKHALEFSGDEDVAISAALDVHTISKKFNSPEKLLTAMEFQIVAGLHTSASQLGGSGAGRQDAETQQDNTFYVIEDVQENIEDWLNKTLIREICLDLFGKYDETCDIKFKFKQLFDEQERKEKHATYLFQAGITDLTETREMVGRGTTPINDKETCFKLYQATEMDGSVSSSNSPSNQHTGSSGTGTTKKTKKD
jgi:hypothetical protein